MTFYYYRNDHCTVQTSYDQRPVGYMDIICSREVVVLGRFNFCWTVSLEMSVHKFSMVPCALKPEYTEYGIYSFHWIFKKGNMKYQSEKYLEILRESSLDLFWTCVQYKCKNIAKINFFFFTFMVRVSQDVHDDTEIVCRFLHELACLYFDRNSTFPSLSCINILCVITYKMHSFHEHSFQGNMGYASLWMSIEIK